MHCFCNIFTHCYSGLIKCLGKCTMSNLWKTYYYCFPKCLGEFVVLYKKNFASWLDFLGNISCCILRWLIFVTYLAIHCLKFPVRPCHLWGQQSQPLHSPLTRCSVSPQALLRGVFALHFSQHRSKFPFGCSLVLVCFSLLLLSLSCLCYSLFRFNLLFFFTRKRY